MYVFILFLQMMMNVLTPLIVRKMRSASTLVVLTNACVLQASMEMEKFAKVREQSHRSESLMALGCNHYDLKQN